MKTAVIYARYSSENQTEQSIEGQLRICQEYAERNGIILLDTYIDRAMTGTNDNRPDFQRMMKDSFKKEWDYVLVYKLDRFSRNKYETAVHKKTLRDNGVKVLSAMENIPDTPEGIILESLLEGMSQYYSAELSQKVKRGMKENRIKGNYQGGGLLYGYRIEGKKIVINETQAEVVKYIFEQYTKGVYVKDIIHALNEKGITRKNKPLNPTHIYGILQNEKYTGVYHHEDETVDNMYPPIISFELMKKAKEIAKKNKHGKRSIKVNYLLRFKLTCGYCGSLVSAETGTSQNGETKYYYKCLGRKHKNGCKKSIVRKNELEKVVIDTIIQELSKPKIMDDIVRSLLVLQNDQMQANSILRMLLKEQNQTEISINNLITAIESGIVTVATAKRLKELEKKQEDLERQILVERSKSTTKVTESDIRTFYEQALRLEPQMLIQYLVDRIVLYDDKIEIYFNSPIKRSPSENSDFFFATKTTLIQAYSRKNSYSYPINVEIRL